MPATEALERLHNQQDLLTHPETGVDLDFQRIYLQNHISIGMPDNSARLYDGIAREDTIVIVGVGLGDEGKGRLVDNKLEGMLSHVEMAYVVRVQGGSNAGHTVEKGDIRLALHQVPSGVLFPQVIGIMDRGMVIHPEDLLTEIESAEEKVGDLRDKLLLSQDAILVTDLERAEELLNRIRHGQAGGGTGRGIGPAYAHFYDRQGLKIRDLVAENWRDTLSEQYDQYEKMFRAFDMDLNATYVPDYGKAVVTKKDEKRMVGTKAEFLDRLEHTRSKLLERRLVANTFVYHVGMFNDLKSGVLFEMSQAVNIGAWTGTAPDTTASDTSGYGIQNGTAFWQLHNIKDRIGVFKIPYTSSVGARHMPTEVMLPKDLKDLPANATADQLWAAHVRVTAHEFGTTTGRPRDILHLDLPMMTYGLRMSGVEVLAGTHLDVAREGEFIKVCTHYLNAAGESVPYQPGLEYQKDVIPQYIELPGWDGEATRRAKNEAELPENARKFLAFIQKRTGYPIIAATTGPDRENMVTFNGYTV